MLKSTINKNGQLERHSTVTEFLPQLDLPALLRIGYRQWPTIIGAIILALALCVLYIAFAQEKFTSSFLLFIDQKRTAVLNFQDPTTSERVLDPGYVESQVEVVKSEGIVRQVVRKLDLAADQSHAGGAPGWYAGLASLVVGQAQNNVTPENNEADIVAAIAQGIKAKRVGASYVLDVSYTGSKPELVYKIAGGLADAYLVGELDARFQATETANGWLRDHIADAQQKVTSADLAVQKFRVDNNLVNTSHGLLTDQQIADATTQLATANLASEEAKAKLDQITKVSSETFSNLTVLDALKSDAINRLREQYQVLSASYNELSARYGKNHEAVVNIHNKMADINKAVHIELDRLAEGSRSEYQLAVSREASLRNMLDGLKQQSQIENEASVPLHNLESNAQIARNTLNTLMQRFEESTQQQTFPIGAARIITPPNYPSAPSWPKKSLVFPAAIVVGILLGFVLAILREIFSGGFRTADDVRSFAGLEYLGTTPRIPKRLLRTRFKNRQVEGILGSGVPVTRQVVVAPFSRFAEAVRNVKVAIDLRKKIGLGTVVAITSAVPKEGKTSLSANLGHLTAQMGHKTLLIDADWHNNSLTKSLYPTANCGVLEVLMDIRNFEYAVKTDMVSGLDFLPAYFAKRVSNAAQTMGSPAMKNLLEILRKDYEYIYLDLPPVVPVVDARANAGLFDFVVFTIEWSRTSREVVREALNSGEALRQRVVGVVLNLADQKELKRLESYRGKAYGSYYSNDEE